MIMNAARDETQSIDPPGDGAADRDWAIALDIITDLQRETTRKQAEVDAAERDKTAMQRTIDEFRYWRRIQDDARKAESAVQAAQDGQDWLPLTQAALVLFPEHSSFSYSDRRLMRDYERVRRWAKQGYVVSRRRGERGELVDIEMGSLRAYMAKRGIS
jgi:hypothetical protein